jgi:hypothetical protein
MIQDLMFRFMVRMFRYGAKHYGLGCMRELIRDAQGMALCLRPEEWDA